MVQTNSFIDESLFDLGTLLSKEKICDICKICKKPHIESKKAVVVKPETKIKEVVQIMKENKTDYVLIRDDNDNATGIFTTSDIISFLAKKDIDHETALVKDFMTKPLLMNCYQSIREIMQFMFRNQRKHVPIVRKETGKIRSVITMEDIVDYIADFFPESLSTAFPRDNETLSSVEGA